MSDYIDIQKEETLKAKVFKDYFGKAQYGYEPNIGNIDFVIADAKTSGYFWEHHYLWAEAKKGVQDVESMMTQLILTCKPTYDKGEYLPPPFVGCFDAEKIAFISFHDILPIFSESDFNWNITPSNHEAAEFQKAKKKVAKFLKNIVVYHFASDKKEIAGFIRQNFVPEIVMGKSPITKNNFVHIYNKWLREVKPFINISKSEWLEFKKHSILDCDFFRADMMSKDGKSIIEKLKIVLENDKYKLQEKIQGRLFLSDINFTDGGIAYQRFWNKYERPPAQEYQKYIIDRRDLLVPQNIREVKGSFFTPAIWVEKSQEYIAKVLGENWQDEYYVWDCAAGTGNLLAGLVNKYNVWASTLDQPDVDTMHALIDGGFNLLHDHVFQFDFLNDSFDKLPAELKKIIDDPKKREKLVIYINPPYAEATSATTITGTGKNKTGVATSHHTRERYQPLIGKATNEISAQFMIRIYAEIPNCKLSQFSKLKFVNGQNFKNFRKCFRAKFKNGFIIRADTFDNVYGKFPIGFTIWDLNGKTFPKSIELDIAERGGTKKLWTGTKSSINTWIKEYDDSGNTAVGFMGNYAPDFLKIHQPFIRVTEGAHHIHYFAFNAKNMIEGSIYFSVRLCIEPTYLNDRDQFLSPNDGWKTDIDFQNDCLLYTLFHGQNRILSAHGVNHWIPFTETEVNAREKFDSRFMSGFLKGKRLSKEAEAVLGAGRELWRYYHAKTKGDKTVSVNASYYDIREYFQGRSERGTMKTKSADEAYNVLIKALRDTVKVLAKKIEPKVYEYGFLNE